MPFSHALSRSSSVSRFIHVAFYTSAKLRLSIACGTWDIHVIIVFNPIIIADDFNYVWLIRFGIFMRVFADDGCQIEPKI